MAYRVPEKLVEDLCTAMMDKFIEKLEEPYEPEDDESVCGKWASEKGESRIFRDHNTSRLFSSRNLWMIRDTCTVGWTRTATVGKQGWPLLWRGTRIHGGHTDSSVVEDDDRDPDPPVVLTLQHHDASS